MKDKRNNRDLKPGEWRIEKFEDDTWEFKARYRMDLLDLLPDYIMRNRAMAIGLYLVFLGILLIGVGFYVEWKVTSLLLAFPLCALGAVFLLLLGWPFRFRRAHGNPQWILDHKLRYREGNRTVTLRSTPGGKLRSDSGSLFPLHCLETLQIDRSDEVPGRVGLWFTGETTSGDRLLSWPGFPEQDALQIHSALLGLIGISAPVAPHQSTDKAATEPDTTLEFDYTNRFYRSLLAPMTWVAMLLPILILFASAPMLDRWAPTINGAFFALIPVALMLLSFLVLLVVLQKMQWFLAKKLTKQGIADFHQDDMTLTLGSQVLRLRYHDIRSLQPIYAWGDLIELRIQLRSRGTWKLSLAVKKSVTKTYEINRDFIFPGR
ncbi:MAG: hypothetical protein FWC54_05980 [Actinomycetia bacterium]|nr:hypothetical protein [Actinomycetes bacterium]